MRGKILLLFWKNTYVTKSPFLMKKWQLLKMQSLLLFFFFGCAFSKPSLTDQLHHKTHLKNQMEKQFYDFRKLKSKIETFRSIFFFPPSHCLSTRSWIKSIARRPFNSEFKSFYNSAIQSNWEWKEEWKKFPLFIFINIMMLKGNFLSLQTSLSGEIERNKLFLWFLDRWERC